MKKMLLLSVLLPAIIGSCSSDDNDKPDPITDTLGTLKIKTSIDTSVNDINALRSDNPQPTYFVTLTGPSNKTMPLPEDGVIDDITAGVYSITLNTFEQMPEASFDNPLYRAERGNVVVNGGGFSEVAMTLTQANVGVSFVYDPSLEEAEMMIVPTVCSGEESLVYEGENRSKKGYFSPGELTLRITCNGVSEKIRNQEFLTFNAELNSNLIITISSDDVSIEPEPEYINLQWVTDYTFFGGDATNPGGYLSLGFCDREEEPDRVGVALTIYAEWPQQRGDLYEIPAGEYHVASTREPFTIYPGEVANQKVRNSYVYARNAYGSLYTDGIWTIEEGRVIITSNGDDDYTVKTRLMGRNFVTGMLEEFNYIHEGTLLILDKHVPMGDINDTTQLPDGIYQGSGIPSLWAQNGYPEQAGPSSWESDLFWGTRNDGTRFIWANDWGMSGYPLFLEYMNNSLFITDVMYPLDDLGLEYITSAALFVLGENLYIITNYIAAWDSSTKTLDFTGVKEGVHICIANLVYSDYFGYDYESDWYADAKIVFRGSGVRTLYAPLSELAKTLPPVKLEGPTGRMKFKGEVHRISYQQYLEITGLLV